MAIGVYGTRNFWEGTAERAIKTFAQALIAAIGTSAVAINSIDWPLALATAATATLLSVLTSLATPSTAAKTETVIIDNTTRNFGSSLENGSNDNLVEI
ncbi:MAG: holin [Mobiluncus sp.]|uniref:holin n=1 Tax=Mobiluncus sp. TaxID=47293 RepID=UPI002583B4F6|nr:holin [Mobiluncus sp.]MCI6583447.1 holin [Mobiluncus sp.]